MDDKELAKMMINPYYIIDENLKIGFKFNLGSHNFSHAHSILTNTLNFLKFLLEFSYINKIMKELTVICARLMNQFFYLNITHYFQRAFLKEGQRNNEIELYKNLKIDHNLKESDIENIDVESPSKHQIQIQETMEPGWIFDKISSMKISFCKNGELNGSCYVKIPLRSSAILIIRNNDKFCSGWSFLASLHPCENVYPNRVSN